MTDIAVIILVGQEKIHMRRCMEKLMPLEPKQVFVIESQPDDGTNEIAIATAKSLGWSIKDITNSTVHLQPSPSPTLHIIFHAWPGLYAKQFNWALDNLPITAKWILRLDADEYLTPETIEKLKKDLCTPTPTTYTSDTVSGLNLELKRRFCGGEIRHATVGIRLARVFRFGCGRCEDREMDEHIYVTKGKLVDYDGAFYDDNMNSMDWWREKHRGYAKREAKDALAFERGEVHFKRSKELYYKQPRYLRAFIYFGIRYFLKGGFLDGYAGWMWNFWQGLWYRLLVDKTIGEMKKGK